MWFAFGLASLAGEVTFPPGYYTLGQISERLRGAGHAVEVDATAAGMVFAVNGAKIPADSLIAALSAEQMLSRREVDGRIRFARSLEWQQQAFTKANAYVRQVVLKPGHHFAAAKKAIDDAFLGTGDQIDLQRISWQASPERHAQAELLRSFAMNETAYTEISMAPQVHGLVSKAYWQAPSWTPLMRFADFFAPISLSGERRDRFSISRVPGDATAFLLPKAEDSAAFYNEKVRRMRQYTGAITWRFDPGSGVVRWSLLGKMPFTGPNERPYRRPSDMALVSGFLGDGYAQSYTARKGPGYATSEAIKLKDALPLSDLPGFGNRRELLLSDFILMRAQAAETPILYRVPTYCNRILPARGAMTSESFWTNAITPGARMAGTDSLVKHRLGGVPKQAFACHLACEPRVVNLKGLTHVADGCDEIEVFSRGSIFDVDFANQRLAGKSLTIDAVMDVASRVLIDKNDGLRTWAAETYAIADPGRLLPFARLYNVSPAFRDLVKSGKRGQIRVDRIPNGSAELVKALTALGSSVPFEVGIGMAGSVALGHLENLPSSLFTVSVGPGESAGSINLLLLWEGEPIWRAVVRGL